MEINKHTIEELNEGVEYSFDKYISQEEINIFCNLTGDFHPLHTSQAYSHEHGFDNIIAHGLLLSAYASRIVGMKLLGENAIVISQQFSYFKPVYVNDLVTIKGTISKIDYRFQLLDVKIKIIKENMIMSEGVIKVKMRK